MAEGDTSSLLDSGHDWQNAKYIVNPSMTLSVKGSFITELIQINVFLKIY